MSAYFVNSLGLSAADRAKCVLNICALNDSDIYYKGFSEPTKIIQKFLIECMEEEYMYLIKVKKNDYHFKIGSKTHKHCTVFEIIHLLIDMKADQ